MTDRKATWRQRQLDRGWTQVRVWVPTQQADFIKAIAETLKPTPLPELEEPPPLVTSEESPTPKMLDYAGRIEEQHGILVPARIKRSKLLLWLWIKRNRTGPSRLDEIHEASRVQKIARIEERIASLQVELSSLREETQSIGSWALDVD